MIFFICPYYKHVFYDFLGCLALICDNCKKHFCGICLNTSHAYKINDNNDAHKAVSNHILKFSQDIIKQYEFHNVYFITSNEWNKWREKIQIDNIIVYLKTIRKEILFECFQQILKIIVDEKLLSLDGIIKLENFIFSHENQGVHLIRISLIFWTIYSYKYNVSINEAIQMIQLNLQDKLDLGTCIKNKITQLYPTWKAIKTKIPGENYSAINYPPEFLPIIAQVVENWGSSKKIW